MLSVTDMAAEKLAQYLEQNDISSAIRVAAMNGCSGPALGLALDDQREDDATLNHGDLQLIINNELLTTLGEVTVDFIEPKESSCGCSGGGGFSVTSTNPLPNSGGGCGGSCSSGCNC